MNLIRYMLYRLVKPFGLGEEPPPSVADLKWELPRQATPFWSTSAAGVALSWQEPVPTVLLWEEQ
jgi:hypothetical protein